MMSTMNKKSRRRVLDTSNECIPIGPVNKKLTFDIDDTEGDSINDDDHHLQELHHFELELDSIDLSLDISEELMKEDKFSPCRTRSGVVYESGMKNSRKMASRRQKKRLNMRSRTSSGQSGTGSLADCSENDSDGNISDHVMADLTEIEERLALPPPLTYSLKPSVSRFDVPRERAHAHGIPSSPISSYLPEDRLSPIKQTAWNQPRIMLSSPIQSPSPPTNNMKVMRLFDSIGSPESACTISSPCSVPRNLPMKSRLLFNEDGEPRRSSYPTIGNYRRNLMETEPMTSTEKRANVNPFTPAAMIAATKKRRNTGASAADTSMSPCKDQDRLQHSLDSMSEPGSDNETSGRFSPLPNKRVRVSDINITRYQEEFLEISEIASGSFGLVKQARHRLDGIVYAIKISKNRLRVNGHDENMAMNEVFAHAALMKHRHVVRYFNSWVEKGQIYIQNEFCEGGSLQKQIEERRISGQKFPETDLKRILIQVAKGLHYIHSNQLVHLDIKPGNILIAVEHTHTPSPQRMLDALSDSGAASGDLSPRVAQINPSSGDSSPGDTEKFCYKIGDLGHVAPIQGEDFSPEEGDCRYMAPEFLEMEVDRSKLPKADIFSLGLTIYEAASLRTLPKNSTDSPDYGDLQQGKLPHLKDYSENFNSLLSKMVHPDPGQRPTASKLLANCELNSGLTKSKMQLTKELKETKEKLMMLEFQLNSSNEMTKKMTKKRLVGKNAPRSDSSIF